MFLDKTLKIMTNDSDVIRKYKSSEITDAPPVNYINHLTHTQFHYKYLETI